MSSPRIITLAFTGAYGMRLLQSLIASGGRVYLLYSSAAQIGARKELDLIDFVVARVLDQLGVAHILGPRWGTHADAPVAIQRA